VTPVRFPLPLRNALAELAIAAFDDADAAAALACLAAPGVRPGPAARARLAAVHLVDVDAAQLLPVHEPYAAAIAAHAGRATRAVRAHRAGAAAARRADAATAAVRRAAALWNEGLFFEVHEVLEAVWKTAAGDLRQALQGLIQVAVAFHHLAHGNLRGARSLLVEGRARLAAVPADVVAADTAALRAATEVAEAALRAGRAAGAPPPLRLRG
jgi:hypothetical protein